MAIKVGIVGMQGNLGSRLIAILNRHPDFEPVFGVVQPDNNLDNTLAALKTNRELKKISWAQKMFLAAKHQEVDKWNKKQSMIEFIPVDQLSLKKECQAVIDVTNFGSSQLLSQYKSFGGPVILQSGAKGGQLISPPLINFAADNLYRQGDCLLSALVPPLSAFSGLKSVRTHIIKQYGDKLGDYPTYQRICTTYLCPEVAECLNKELASLLPDVSVNVENVYQIAGQIYYTAYLALELDKKISGEDLRQMLENRPRLIIADSQITSAYDIEYYLSSRLQMNGLRIPPIVIYDKMLFPQKGKASNKVNLTLAIDYRLIAVLPNLDALGVLCLGLAPLEAMQRTDQIVSKLPF